jgi:hypothetical protein
MLEIKELTSQEDTQWDHIVESSSGGILFHLSAWLELLRQVQGTRLYKYGIFDDHVLVGVFPLFVKSIGPFRVAGSPVIAEDTPYMGPVIGPEHLPHVLRWLDGEMGRLGVHFVRIIFPPGLPRPDVEHQGYVVHRKIAHVVDLSLGEEKLFGSFTKNCRKKIRKAERLGVNVCWTKRPADWERQFELLSELCRGQGRLPPNTGSFYTGLRQRFEHTGHIALAVSQYDDAVIAAQIYGLYKGIVYCLNEASQRDLRHIAPNDAKHWEGMKTYIRQGYRLYDIGNADTENLAEYKRNFGGMEAEYFVLERSRSRLCSWLRSHYTWYRYLKMWTSVKLHGLAQRTSERPRS